MAGLGGSVHGRNTVLKLDDLSGALADISALLMTSGLPSQSAGRPVTKTYGSHARRTTLGFLDGGTIPIGGKWRKDVGVNVHGKGARILFDRYSIAADLASTVLRRSIDVPPLKTYPDGVSPAWVRRPLIGAQDGSLSFSGLLNAAAGKVDSVWRAAKQTATPAIVTIAGNGFTIGNLLEMGKFVIENYSINSPAEGPAEASADLSSDDVQDLGVSLHDLTAETVLGTTNFASVDETASTALGWVAHLHVTAYSGWTDATIKIQDSADNAAWADLASATFTAVTGVAEQRLEGTATAVVRRYVRAVLTTTGVSGSITFVVSFARRGYTYGSAATHRHIAGLFGKSTTSSFEYGPEGSATGALKQSGECRLQDLEITFPVDDDAAFSGTLVVDGAITDGTWA